MQKPFELLATEARQRFSRQPKPVVTGLGLGFVLVLEVINYLLGSPVWFSFFYLIPISLVTWRVGLLQGVLIASIGALPCLVCDSISATAYSRSILAFWNSAVRLEFFFMSVLALSILKMKTRRLQEKLAESTIALEAALAKHNQAEAVLKSLGMKDKEFARGYGGGLHQPGLKGEFLCFVDSVGDVYLMNPSQLAIRWPRPTKHSLRVVSAAPGGLNHGSEPPRELKV